MSGERLAAFDGVTGQTLWRNVYFGSTLIATQNYFHGVYMGVSPVARDRVGSVRVGAGGSSYYPYREEYTVNGEDTEKFATYFRDSTSGLDYAKKRYYNSILGRFMSPDPYMANNGGAGDAADPGSWNRYAYTRGDPVNFNDPAGQYSQGPTDPSGPDAEDCIIAPDVCLVFDSSVVASLSSRDPGPSFTYDSLYYDFKNSGFGSVTPGPSAGTLNLTLSAGGFLAAGGLLPPLAGVGAAGGTIELGEGIEIVLGTAIGPEVVLAGIGLYLAYEIWQHIEHNRTQAGQAADINWANAKYKQQCNKTLSRGEQRRLHDEITGLGLSREQILQLMKDLFGCPGQQGH